jgi:hypothetical protein
MKLFLCLVVIGLSVLGIAFIPFPAVRDQPPQTLADPQALATLIAGKDLPIPPDATRGEYLGTPVTPLPIAKLLGFGNRRVLGQTNAIKRIEVDLTQQKVYAYEGNIKVMEFIVSTGKWWPTPTGEFTIWTKVRSQRMEGGNPAWGTYYNLPNVPFVMFFYNSEVNKMRGFSFHGAYWHNNFGHPMSHGCVNMKIPDAQALYDWATPVVTNPKAWSTLASAENQGTRVLIYGRTPRE